MKHTILKIVFCLAIPALFPGCQHSDDVPQDPDNNLVGVNLVISRANYVDGATGASTKIGKRTYRAVLYNLAGEMKHEGSYYDESGEGTVTGMLTPWEVGKAGEKVGTAIDKSQALYAPRGEYMMVLVSPGYKIEKIPEMNGIKGRWGYLYRRKPVVDYDHRGFLTDVFYIKLTVRGEEGFNVVDLTRNDLHPHNDVTLKERRAKVQFNLLTGPALTEVNIKKVEFKTFAGAYYDPFHMEFVDMGVEDKQYTNLLLYNWKLILDHDKSKSILLPLQEETARALGATEDTFTWSETEEEFNHNGSQYVFLLAHDYGKKDKNGDLVYKSPELILHLGNLVKDDDTKDTEVHVPLAYKIEAHKRYKFDITINSTFVNITVHVADWGDGGNINPVVDDAKTIDLGKISISGWEESGGTKFDID